MSKSNQAIFSIFNDLIAGKDQVTLAKEHGVGIDFIREIDRCYIGSGIDSARLEECGSSDDPCAFLDDRRTSAAGGRTNSLAFLDELDQDCKMNPRHIELIN